MEKTEIERIIAPEKACFNENVTFRMLFKDFKSIISYVSSMQINAEFYFRFEQIEIIFMEFDRIVLSRICIPVERLTDYSLTGEFAMMLNLDKLNYLIKDLDPEGAIYFEKRGHQFTLQRETLGNIREKVRLDFQNGEIDQIGLPLPINRLRGVEYSVELKVDNKAFRDRILQISNYENIETVKLGYNKQDKIEIAAEFGGRQEYQYCGYANIYDVVEILPNEVHEAEYNFKYFYELMKRFSADETTIIFRKDYPVWITLMMESIEIEFFASPRVEDSEFEEDEF